MSAEHLSRYVRTHRKHLSALALIALVAAVGIFAYARGEERELTNWEKVIATVNGTPITAQRFNESYVNFLITTGQHDTRGHRYLHLNALLDTYILADEARRRGLDEDPGFKEYYDRKLSHTVGGQFYQESFLDTLAPLTDDEIRLAFQRSKEQVVIRHLLFRDSEAAEEAHARLEEGEDFIQLANEVFETAEYDSMAGFLGVASYWELDDDFAEAAFSQPVGMPTPPVRTRYGYHIILVEDHLINPLLTESEYQYRRKGVSQKAHMRKMRREGSRFVHDYMMGLNVRVNEPAIVELREAIQRLTVEPHPRTYQPPPQLSNEEVGQLRASFTPETPLLTYELNGERHVFTALDYYRWLEELPYGEARNRTGASVGRALRNEVLARSGFQEELDKHEVVTEYVQFASNVYLANALREHLRTNERAEPTEEEVADAFDRLRYRTIKRAVADFWIIPFGGFREADEAKRAVLGGADPATYAGYQYHEEADLRPLRALGGHVRRALLDSPVVLGTGESEWYLLNVDDRTVEWTTLEEKESQIREVLATTMPEARLATELRNQADVTVDSALFEAMMQR